MGDTPTMINRPATLANEAIGFMVNVMFDGAKGAAIVAAPWLGWPIVSQVFSYVLGLANNYVYMFLAMKGTFLIIAFQTAEERDAAIASRDKLASAIVGGDVNAIIEASKKFDADFDRLIHWNGSARP